MKEVNNTYSCFIPALDASDIGISANLRSEKWRPMVAIGGGIADLSTGDSSFDSSLVAPGFEDAYFQCESNGNVFIQNDSEMRVVGNF